jgi:hypothetical protein
VAETMDAHHAACTEFGIELAAECACAQGPALDPKKCREAHDATF